MKGAIFDASQCSTTSRYKVTLTSHLNTCQTIIYRQETKTNSSTGFAESTEIILPMRYCVLKHDWAFTATEVFCPCHSLQSCHVLFIRSFCYDYCKSLAA